MLNRIKVLIVGMAAVFVPLLAVATPVTAVDIGQSVCNDDVQFKPEICGDIEGSNQDDAVNPLYGPSGIITRIASALSLIIGVIAILIIIIAGIKMTISSGDSGKVKASRDQIIYASVGLIIAVLAQGIVQFVLNRIGES